MKKEKLPWVPSRWYSFSLLFLESWLNCWVKCFEAGTWGGLWDKENPDPWQPVSCQWLADCCCLVAQLTGKTRRDPAVLENVVLSLPRKIKGSEKALCLHGRARWPSSRTLRATYHTHTYNLTQETGASSQEQQLVICGCPKHSRKWSMCRRQMGGEGIP